MTIGELIFKLHEVADEHGDNNQVFIEDADTCWFLPNLVVMVTTEDKSGAKVVTIGANYSDAIK